MNRLTLRIALALLLLTPAAGDLLAGPPNPPAGPVAPTMKTLSEVEPRIAINSTNTPGDATCLFKITQSGSYYLTGNITGVAGKSAIIIYANNVTLDLSGFNIKGGQHGVLAVPPPPQGVATTIVVRNGTVDSCSLVGINLESTFNTVIENVMAQSCADTGIKSNVHGIVRNCGANGCGIGIRGTANVQILNCISENSTGDGFMIGWDCVVDTCTSNYNTGNGFWGGVQNTIRNSLSRRAGAIGITVADESLVEHCQVVESVGNGINVGPGATVRDCTVSSGQADGVVCAQNCSILSNTIYDNAQSVGTGTGLRVAANDCVIQDNRVSSNGQWGIWVSGTGNFVARNWSRGHTNTNIFIAANNDSGPIVNAPGTGFVNTNPWTNFTR